MEFAILCRFYTKTQMNKISHIKGIKKLLEKSMKQKLIYN